MATAEKRIHWWAGTLDDLRSTPKQDIDRIVGRIKAVRQWRDSPEGKVAVASALADLKQRQTDLDEKERKNALKPK